MVSSLGEVFLDLGFFLRRNRVVELLVAFAVASASVAFISGIVNGLIYSPLTTADDSFSGSNGVLDFVIGGRVFEASFIVTSGLLLCLVLVGAAVYVHVRDEEVELGVDCPHCLSQIPVAAAVCSHCTRDVPRSATHS